MSIDLFVQQLPGMGVEVGIPAGWTRQGEHDATQVRFLAPSVEGYRSVVAMQQGRLDPPTPAGFESLIEAVPDAMTRRLPNSEVLAVRRFAQQGLPACVFRVRWRPDSPPPGAERIDTIEQLTVLVVTDPDTGRLLQLDATTIAPLADEHLPLLQAIVETTRPMTPDGDSADDAQGAGS